MKRNIFIPLSVFYYFPETFAQMCKGLEMEIFFIFLYFFQICVIICLGEKGRKQGGVYED